MPGRRDPAVQDVLDALADHVAVLDGEGRIVAVNDAWRRFAVEHGGDPVRCGPGASYLAECEEALRRRPDREVEVVLEALREVLSGRRHDFSCEYRCGAPSGELWFSLTAMRCPRAGASCVVVAHHDVTSRKAVESAHRAREEQWRQLFAILPVGVSILDEKRRIVDMNPALARILQLSPRALESGRHRARRYVHPDGRPVLPHELPSAEALRERRPVEDVEIGIETPDGELLWTSVSAAPLPLPDARAVVVTVDITSRRRAERELRLAKERVEAANLALQEVLRHEQAIARTDPLTGIANRREFFEVAARQVAIAQRSERPLSLVLFDIDTLKRVNDTHGHESGDTVIQEVARRALEDHLRQVDVLARYGGDEFVALLSECDADEASAVAERLRAGIAGEPVATRSGPVEATISVGTATLRPDDALADLIRRADEALYAAKAAGRNQVIVGSPEPRAAG